MVLLWQSSLASAQERVWVDNTGKHKLEATFEKLEEATVFLRTAEDKLIQIPLEKLCEADQAFVKDLTQPKTDVAQADKTTADEKSTSTNDSSSPGKNANPKTNNKSSELKNSSKKETSTNQITATNKNQSTAVRPTDSNPATEKPEDRGEDPTNTSRTPLDGVEIAAPNPGLSASGASQLQFQSSIDLQRVNSLEPPYREIGLAIRSRENVLSVGKAYVQLAELESAPPVIVELLHESTKSTNKYIRIQALKLLAILAPEESYDCIIKSVSDSSFNMRWTALELIEYLDDPRGLDILVERFPSRDRNKIVSVLTSMGTRHPIEEKIFPLLDHENRNVVLDAIRLLARVGSQKSIEKIQPFRDAENALLRLQAKSALESIGKRLGQIN